MKTLFSKRPGAIGLLKSLCLLVILAACSDEPEILPSRPNATTTEESNARLGQNLNRINYDLNVLLFTTERSSTMGFIKFRQYVDGAQMVNLDTRVHGLEPNTNYLLQRAVDTTLDGDCTSTTWLTLGKGLDPFPITTNDKGSGEAELFRSVAAAPVGTTFDIHFQIVKESTSEVVLTSDCYQYTVR